MQRCTICRCYHCEHKHKTPKPDCGEPLHPNHSAQFVANYVLAQNSLPGNRCTGRTTALAFALIAKAMREPRKWHVTVDHHGSLDSDRYLKDTIETIVSNTGLQGFVFREREVTWGLPA